MSNSSNCLLFNLAVTVSPCVPRYVLTWSACSSIHLALNHNHKEKAKQTQDVETFFGLLLVHRLRRWTSLKPNWLNVLCQLGLPHLLKPGNYNSKLQRTVLFIEAHWRCLHSVTIVLQNGILRHIIITFRLNIRGQKRKVALPEKKYSAIMAMVFHQQKQHFRRIVCS